MLGPPAAAPAGAPARCWAERASAWVISRKPRRSSKRALSRAGSLRWASGCPWSFRRGCRACRWTGARRGGRPGAAGLPGCRRRAAGWPACRRTGRAGRRSWPAGGPCRGWRRGRRCRGGRRWPRRRGGTAPSARRWGRREVPPAPGVAGDFLSGWWCRR